MKTLEDVKGPNLDACPTEGDVKIIGAKDSNVEMKFQEDSSVVLNVNGEEFKTYSSCDDMPSCK